MGGVGNLDVEGKELPRLVYVSRENRPGYQLHRKAGALNALVCFLNLDFKLYLLLLLRLCYLERLLMLRAMSYFLKQARVSGVLTNAPFLLNLDCDRSVTSPLACDAAVQSDARAQRPQWRRRRTSPQRWQA